MPVKIFGPAAISAVTERVGGLDIRVAAAIESDARTLGAALQDFEREADAIVRPYDGSYQDLAFGEGETPKYFVVSLRARPDITHVVDIHIQRGDTTICPKQDLSFPLEDGDELHCDVPVC